MLAGVGYRVLGSVDVIGASNGPVTVESGKQRLLLAVLLTRPAAAVSVDRIVDVLWGDDVPNDPAGALQSQVSRLRRRLPAGDELVRRGGAYVLEVEPGEIDAVRFERLVEAARRETEPAERLARFDEALALWQGDAYGELATEPALLGTASRLEELRVAARLDRAEALLELGRNAAAVAEADVLAHDHPHDERPVSVLMRALHRAGRQADALRAFQRFRATVTEELGLEPSPALRALEGEVLRHADATPPPPAPAPAAPPAAPASLRALPRLVTSFVGRRAELDVVLDLVGRSRIVTLTGPGGVGKTRLALEAATQVSGGREVAFCDLSTLDDGASVGDAVATTLGVQHVAGQALTARLAEVLDARPVLLVLDNCEHVIDAAAELVDQLARGTTGVHVLATSRVPLAVDGEHRVSLTPLGLDGEAVALLADRVRAVRPELVGTADFTSHAAAIARRVDGLPLAVELAAGRLAVASPAEVRAELDERLADLAAPRRTAPRRHRSLTALVQWSYEQLSPKEAEVFDHFAVFAGGASAEAVAAVTGEDVPATRAVLESLVEQSLLVRREVDGRSRFVALDTLRAFAEERLTERGTLSEAHDRHAQHMLATVEWAAAELRGPHPANAAAVLDAELTNLRVAHRHLVERCDADRCLRMHQNLVWFALFNEHSELHLWAEEAATRFPEPRPGLAIVLGSASFGAWRRGDLSAAERLARTAIDVAPDPIETSLAWGGLGDSFLFRGDLATAIPHYTRSVELARGSDPVTEPMALANLALAVGYAGDYARACRLADEALAVAEAADSGLARAFARYARGEVAVEHDLASARRDLADALRLAEQHATPFLAGVGGLSAVSVEMRIGHPEAVVAGFPGLLDRWQRAGTWNQLWTGTRVLVEALGRLGQDEDAARLLGVVGSRDTSAAIFGGDAERMAAVRAELVVRLGAERVAGLAAEGAALDDPAAMTLARRAAEAAAGKPSTHQKS
jgi:predicted ATPase/DNA-binding SARP family transcriptional activator